MPTSVVLLISQPNIDFTTFLGLAHKVLGYSPSANVDQSRLDHSDAERFLSCLAALRDPNAPAGITPNLLAHVSYTVLMMADERDLIDILEATAGIPVVTSETLARNVMLAILTGTLAQWRDAVVSGSTRAAEFNVRQTFCQIMSLFEQAGLGKVWKDYQSKPLDDNTFYLEYKPR
jgi:hypothetical protein